jgi:hypothetical protein
MPIDRDPATLIDVLNACQLIEQFLKDRDRSELDSDLLIQI